MLQPLHIRCKACHTHLAGPVYKKNTPTIQYIEFDEWLTADAFRFGVPPVHNLEPDSPDDILVHAQWYKSWRTGWPERAEGAARRPMVIGTSGYGCCGPNGVVACRCRVVLGSVYADCLAEFHRILLMASRVERSDQIDGYWHLRADATCDDEWMESSGHMESGRRQGEWIRMHRTYPDVDPVVAAIEQWEDGVLVDSTDM